MLFTFGTLAAGCNGDNEDGGGATSGPDSEMPPPTAVTPQSDPGVNEEKDKAEVGGNKDIHPNPGEGQSNEAEMTFKALKRKVEANGGITDTPHEGHDIWIWVLGNSDVSIQNIIPPFSNDRPISSDGKMAHGKTDGEGKVKLTIRAESGLQMKTMLSFGSKIMTLT